MPRQHWRPMGAALVMCYDARVGVAMSRLRDLRFTSRTRVLQAACVLWLGCLASCNALDSKPAARPASPATASGFAGGGPVAMLPPTVAGGGTGGQGATGSAASGMFGADDGGAGSGPRVPNASAEHEIVRPGCERRAFAAGALIEPAPCLSPNGCKDPIECLGPWDCGGGLARCVGSAGTVCEYGGTRAPESCTVDTDCSSQPDGHCSTLIGITFCTDRHECDSDAECTGGQRCACTADALVCIDADCKEDSDCGPGHGCKRSFDQCGFPFGPFRCTTDEDRCRQDADCERGRCDFIEGFDFWGCDLTPQCTIP